MNFRLSKGDLSLNLYSANITPVSGVENDIVVITDVSMKNWILSPSSPMNEPRSEGDVWIQYSVSGDVFDAMIVNDFMLSIVSMHQYVNGDWIRRASKQYKNGAWVNVTTLFAAYINISYPPGSACKVTHADGDVFIAPDNSGVWLFTAPKKGSWKVECEDGDMSADETVSINSEGESKSVDLAYFEYIIKNGKLRSGYTFINSSLDYTEADGYAQFNTKNGSGGNGKAVISKDGNVISMMDSSKLRITLEISSKRTTSDDVAIVGIANLADASTGIQTNQQFNNIGGGNSVEKQTIDLNIEALDKGYFAVSINDYATYLDLKLYDVWFE